MANCLLILWFVESHSWAPLKGIVDSRKVCNKYDVESMLNKM
jgi:hypothetical protein